jgi:hypothetical protein
MPEIQEVKENVQQENQEPVATQQTEEEIVKEIKDLADVYDAKIKNGNETELEISKLNRKMRKFWKSKSPKSEEFDQLCEELTSKEEALAEQTTEALAALQKLRIVELKYLGGIINGLQQQLKDKEAPAAESAPAESLQSSSNVSLSAKAKEKLVSSGKF